MTMMSSEILTGKSSRYLAKHKILESIKMNQKLFFVGWIEINPSLLIMVMMISASPAKALGFFLTTQIAKQGAWQRFEQRSIGLEMFGRVLNNVLSLIWEMFCKMFSIEWLT